MSKRISISIRNNVINDYIKVTNDYNFSQFVALCVLAYCNNNNFKKEIEKNYKLLFKK